VAALERARTAAYPPGEYVGQESFMCAGEIRRLARQAAIGPGVSVLDLCCGVAGPGRLITAETGCSYLGLDSSQDALEIARSLAGDLPCRFALAHLPPLPDEHFQVVLLLETLLAFADKRALLDEVGRVVEPGGRFACTVEAGRLLDTGERSRMPDAETVFPIELPELTALMRDAGLVVTWQQDWSASHREAAIALLASFRIHSAEISRGIGRRALDELVAAHRLWSEWLGAGRVRKFVLVAERR
jgi:SAM-dependent methyltransferase